MRMLESNDISLALDIAKDLKRIYVQLMRVRGVSYHLVDRRFTPAISCVAVIGAFGPFSV